MIFDLITFLVGGSLGFGIGLFISGAVGAVGEGSHIKEGCEDEY
mgnify:CR=1 FL=1|jgi:hypothetical protein